MIKVEGISKQFKLYRSPADRLKEIIFRKKYHKDFVALDNISFEIGPGETLGIIGQNGAGKSTLLKILSGIVIPDKGTIQIDGKVTGLLELGTGFNAEMTGLENIYMNGTLIGMTREEIDRKKQTIIDFSELGEFINEPIKTYSSGMVMRLAFSIAIHADPTCFLVDEALSVGDAYFQQKCMRKIQEFRAKGGSIILVSHDMTAIQTLCDNAIMINQGKLVTKGDSKQVIDFYKGSLLERMHEGNVPLEVGSLTDDGHIKHSQLSTREVELTTIELRNDHDEETLMIDSESVFSLNFNVRTLKDLEDPHYGFTIKNYLGITVFETNTHCMNIKTKPLKKKQIAQIRFKMFCSLAPGNYSISIGLGNMGFGTGQFKEYLLLVNDVKILKVVKSPKSITYGGIFNMSPIVTVEQS